jgi:F-type H+-transporting ATPase subunit delta
MQAASREAADEVRTELDAVLGRFSATSGMTELAEQLYAVAELLTAAPQVRRRLADSAAPVEARSGLAERLLSGKVSASALRVVTAAVSQRWSAAWDLVDVLETGADTVLLAAAESEGVLDAVEDELFRLERILDAESSLTTLLDESTVPGPRRAELAGQVLSGKVHPLTLALVRHAVTTQRKRSVLLAVDDLIEAAGARRHRSIARVVSAVELTDQHQGDLAERLSEMYGRRIEVRTAIDPRVRGGLVVRIGDEVIDGSVATRFTQIREALAS